LSEGKLYAADKDLNRISTIVYPILKILRSEAGEDLEYKTNGLVKVVDGITSTTLIEKPKAELAKWADNLLAAIRNAKGSSFAVPDVSANLSSIRYNTLKAQSTDKRDITIVVHDYRTGMNPTLGFSIKSMLGGASTLLNAGKTTNFLFELAGRDVSVSDLDPINSIGTNNKIRDRLKMISGMGLSLEFRDMESEIFRLNLAVIDSKLPEIVASMLLLYHRDGISEVSNIIERLSSDNPMKYNLEYSHNFYEYKLSNLLTDIALGMTPSKVWSGNYDASGGYIIVRQDGEVVCYHVYNRNDFQKYLVNNTRLDTASTSRHRFGFAYKDGGKAFVKLNLQIRFK
jgi:type II restriction enzyme